MLIIYSVSTLSSDILFLKCHQLLLGYYREHRYRKPTLDIDRFEKRCSWEYMLSIRLVSRAVQTAASPTLLRKLTLRKAHIQNSAVSRPGKSRSFISLLLRKFCLRPNIVPDDIVPSTKSAEGPERQWNLISPFVARLVKDLVILELRSSDWQSIARLVSECITLKRLGCVPTLLLNLFFFG